MYEVKHRIRKWNIIILSLFLIFVAGCNKTVQQSNQPAGQQSVPPVKPELKLVRSFSSPNMPMLSNVAFSQDGTQVAVGIGNSVGFWNVQDGVKTKEISVIYRGDDGVRRVSYYPNGGAMVASTGRWGPTNWINLTTNEVVAYEGGDAYAHAFSNDGKYLVYTTNERDVNVVIVANQSIKKYANQIEKGVIGQLLYSPNGQHLLFGVRYANTQGAASEFFIKDTQGYKKEYYFAGDYYAIMSMGVFSPDSKVLAFGNSGRIQLYNIETKDMRIIQGRSQQEIHSMVYLPNGKYLAVGYSSGIVDILDTTSYQTIYSKECGFMRSLSVSSNGVYLAYFDIDNVLQIWDCSSFR